MMTDASTCRMSFTTPRDGQPCTPRSEEQDMYSPRLVYVPFELKDHQVPKEWREADPGFVRNFNDAFRKILPEGISALAESELTQTLRGLFRTMQTWATDLQFVTSVIEDEGEFQAELRKALRQVPLDIKEGTEIAGGETDLIAFRRVLIENKWQSTQTDNPLQVKPRTGRQGRRYTLPTGQPFVITALAYPAKSENGHLPPHKCVAVRQLAGITEPFVEIRIAVRYGDMKPSDAA